MSGTLAAEAQMYESVGLDRSLEQRDPGLVRLKAHPLWDRTRSASRYRNALRRMGLEP